MLQLMMGLCFSLFITFSFLIFAGSLYCLDSGLIHTKGLEYRDKSLFNLIQPKIVPYKLQVGPPLYLPALSRKPGGPRLKDT